MNLTQVLSIIITLILLNLLWGLKPQKIKDPTVVVSVDKSKETGSAEKIFFTALLLIPLILCLWMINIWFTSYNQSMQAVNWNVVTGVVLEKRVGDVAVSGDYVNNNVRGNNYQPYIEYAYTLNGEEYISHNISFLKLTEFYESYDAQTYLDQFPEIGEKIQIYTREYESKLGLLKSESTLKVGSQDIEYLGVTITSIFALLSLVGLRAIYF